MHFVNENFHIILVSMLCSCTYIDGLKSFKWLLLHMRQGESVCVNGIRTLGADIKIIEIDMRWLQCVAGKNKNKSHAMRRVLMINCFVDISVYAVFTFSNHKCKWLKYGILCVNWRGPFFVVRYDTRYIIYTKAFSENGENVDNQFNMYANVSAWLCS